MTHRTDGSRTLPAPPPLAARLLERRLHPDERDEILGDLAEQFARLAAARSPHAARRWYWRQAAALAFGFAIARRDLISTAHERRRGWWAAGTLMTDVRQAVRGLRHSPSFTTVALLTLTCGIGLSTAVFSSVGSIFVRPLPFADADRLVRLAESGPRAPLPASGGSLADTTFGVWHERRDSLDAIAWYSPNRETVTTPAGAANLRTVQIGEQFFDVLRITPLSGRLPAGSDADAGDPVAVISERLWRTDYKASHDTVGRTIAIDGLPRVIAAVVPRAFALPDAETDVWVRTPRRWPQPGARRNIRGSVAAVGRLAVGREAADAQAEGVSIVQAIALSDPASLEGDVQIPAVRVRPLKDDLIAPVRPVVITLGAGMAIVLLAACVNLANLLLARQSSRQRELAVRVALGASRWRLVRPMLLEQALLSSAGGVAGGALAWWLIGAIPAVAPADVPRLESLRFDTGAFAFAVGVSMATTMAVGLMAIRGLGRGRVADLAGERTRLAGTPRSADAVRGALVVGQVTLAVVLLVGALLVGRSVVALLGVHPGYQPEGVLTLQASFPATAFRQEGLMRGFYTGLLERVRRHPSVVSAGYTMSLPLRQVGLRSSVNVVGRPIEPPASSADMAIQQAVDKTYLQTVGTRIVRGRGFTAADTAESQKVLVIDETIARRHFAGEDPIGRQLRGPRAEPWTIVGVAEAVHATGLAEDADPIVYFHAPQRAEIMSYFPTASGLAVRTTGDPLDLVPYVREQARAIDATIPIFAVDRLSDRLSATIAEPRFVAIVLALFASLALTTAILGIYGVLSYLVECRRREFGVRRALGASEAHIIGLVTRRGFLLAAIGIGGGLAAGAAASRFLTSLLFSVRPADPASYAGAALVVLVVTALASWQPLLRALRVDPARTLRVE